tara:strand:- start:179 stop:862 length:684 start_codon:yes stop_codon:yes gene_type:complete
MSRNYYRRVSNSIVVATPSSTTNPTGGTETTQVTYFMNTNGQENQNVENAVVLMNQTETTNTSTGSDGDLNSVNLEAINATISHLEVINTATVSQIEAINGNISTLELQTLTTNELDANDIDATDVDAGRLEGDRIFSGNTDITNIFIDNNEFAEEQEKYEELLILVDGQTEWTLNEPVNSPEKTELFLNGLKQDYGLDFNVVDNKVIYLERHYGVETDDFMEVVYK